MNSVKVYGAFISGGDGSVAIRWFLTNEQAETAEESQSEGWGECCVTSVETFEGSSTHNEAIGNSAQWFPNGVFTYPSWY